MIKFTGGKSSFLYEISIDGQYIPVGYLTATHSLYLIINKKLKVMYKEKLESLVSLPKNHFDAIIKLINPKVTDSDLAPMFPEGWDDDSKWFETTYNYDSFRHIQIQIDEYNETMVGC